MKRIEVLSLQERKAKEVTDDESEGGDCDDVMRAG